MTARGPRPVTALAVALVLVGIVGCHGRDSASLSKPSASSSTASSAQTPLDRLLPGELSASAQLAFGFPIPNGMTIERAFPDAVHLAGEVTVGGLTDYVSKHAQVAAPELTGKTLVFDRAHIPSQGPKRLYRFEIAQRGHQVKLLVKDMTPPEIQPGLSEEEQWKQAGRKPNGDPLSISDLR